MKKNNSKNSSKGSRTIFYGMKSNHRNIIITVLLSVGINLILYSFLCIPSLVDLQIGSYEFHRIQYHKVHWVVIFCQCIYHWKFQLNKVATNIVRCTLYFGTKYTLPIMLYFATYYLPNSFLFYLKNFSRWFPLLIIAKNIRIRKSIQLIIFFSWFYYFYCHHNPYRKMFWYIMVTANICLLIWI